LSDAFYKISYRLLCHIFAEDGIRNTRDLVLFNEICIIDKFD